MPIHDAKHAKNRLKMLGMLDKQEQSSTRPGSFAYDQGKMITSPAALRPRATDPAQRLTRWVQAALITLLGIKLPLDGVMSTALRAALLAFQKKAGLTQSGAVDSDTLKLLQEMVGLPAPAGNETAPPPWADAKPAEAPQQPKEKPSKNKVEGAEADKTPEVPAAVGHADSAERLQRLVLERFLQREALQAVMAQAFERNWLAAEAERSGRVGESALLAELLAWWERAQAPERETPPLWMGEVTSLARAKPNEAVELVRKAWRSEGEQQRHDA